MENQEFTKHNATTSKPHLFNFLFRLLIFGMVAIPFLALYWALHQRPTPLPILVGLGAILLLIPMALVLPLRWLRPRASALMIQKQWGLGGMTRPEGGVVQQWVALEEMPPDLLLATIIMEDTHFPLHFGFDFESLRKAQEHNKTHAHKRGGSTITQQLAKNLFLWPDASYPRKLIEAYFTLLMEGFWPKRRILEIYLNIVRLDLEIFGVGAAAQHLLGKPVATLSRQECALMAAAIASPLRFRIAAPDHIVRFRQTMILARMKQMGHEYLELL